MSGGRWKVSAARRGKWSWGYRLCRRSRPTRLHSSVTYASLEHPPHRYSTPAAWPRRLGLCCFCPPANWPAWALGCEGRCLGRSASARSCCCTVTTSSSYSCRFGSSWRAVCGLASWTGWWHDCRHGTCCWTRWSISASWPWRHGCPCSWRNVCSSPRRSKSTHSAQVRQVRSAVTSEPLIVRTCRYAWLRDRGCSATLWSRFRTSFSATELAQSTSRQPNLRQRVPKARRSMSGLGDLIFSWWFSSLGAVLLVRRRAPERGSPSFWRHRLVKEEHRQGRCMKGRWLRREGGCEQWSSKDRFNSRRWTLGQTAKTRATWGDPCMHGYHIVTRVNQFRDPSWGEGAPTSASSLGPFKSHLERADHDRRDESPGRKYAPFHLNQLALRALSFVARIAAHQPWSMDSFVQHVQDTPIGVKYRLRRTLGSGTFGSVYLGNQVHPSHLCQPSSMVSWYWPGSGCDVTTDEEVALKLEHHTVHPSLLEQEVDIYTSLAGQVGFPQVCWHGVKDDFNVMVFELLGPNLEDLFQYCGRRFSLKTSLLVMDQLLARFETLHNRHYLHRDVKPENFLLGTGRHGNTIYMTDLGLAVERRGERDVPNNSSTVSPQLVGTCRYASINGHLGGGEQRMRTILAAADGWTHR